MESLEKISRATINDLSSQKPATMNKGLIGIKTVNKSRTVIPVNVRDNAESRGARIIARQQIRSKRDLNGA